MGPICRATHHMDRFEYCYFLRHHLLQYAQRTMPDLWYYQQDNDSKHSAKLVKKFLRDNNVNVFPWPSRSPYMSPIENVWAHIKRQLSDRIFLNANQLAQAIVEEWKRVPQSLVQNLYVSMPRRIHSLLKSRGFTTKY